MHGSWRKRQEYGDLEKRIDELRSERQAFLLEDANNESVRRQLEMIEKFVKEQDGPVAEYDEALVRKLISKVTVHDDKMVFEFKSGLEIEI